MAKPTMPIVEIRNVSKTFMLQGQPIHALKDATLTIQRANS